MEKLSRLGWTVGFSFKAYGTRVGVRTNNPALLDALRARLPIGWKPSSSPLVEAIFSIKDGSVVSRPGIKQYHLLYSGITRLMRTFDFEAVLGAFETAVQLHVAEMAHHHTFVHAGVIAWRNTAIILPGQSMSGKSSLVRAFLKAGAKYYSDEFALLDKNGHVHPYPVPLGNRPKIDEKQSKTPVGEYGTTPGKKPLPVGLVLITRYQEGARWRPKQIPAGQGLLSILSNTVSAQRNPAKALATLQQIVLKAPVLKGTRGETDEVVEALLNRPWPTL